MKNRLARGVALSYLGRVAVSRPHTLPTPVPVLELDAPRIDSSLMRRAFGIGSPEGAAALMKEEQSGSTLWVTRKPVVSRVAIRRAERQESNGTA